MRGFTHGKKCLLNLYVAQFPGCREGRASGLFARLENIWRGQAETRPPVVAMTDSPANMGIPGLAAGDPMGRN